MNIFYRNEYHIETLNSKSLLQSASQKELVPFSQALKTKCVNLKSASHTPKISITPTHRRQN